MYKRQANLQKQMNASRQQVEAIRQLIREDRLTALPLSLQQIALALSLIHI